MWVITWTSTTEKSTRSKPQSITTNERLRNIPPYFNQRKKIIFFLAKTRSMHQVQTKIPLKNDVSKIYSKIPSRKHQHHTKTNQLIRNKNKMTSFLKRRTFTRILQRNLTIYSNCLILMWNLQLRLFKI